MEVSNNVEDMNIDEGGSYYVSVSHVSVNMSADHQKDVQAVQTVSTKPPLVPCKEDAKPPKTPKTSGRFERERTTSNSSMMDDEFYLQPRSSSRKSSTKSREGSCSRDTAAESLRGSNGSLERETCFERRDVEEVRILEPQDGRRSAHELSQTEKRKSNKDRFQGGGGKRFSRSVGSKSSTLSLHNTKAHNSAAGPGGEDDLSGGDGGSTPLLQRRNSIHIIPYVDVNDPETRCRMERYKEERRSILRSKYKPEDYRESDRDKKYSSDNSSQDDILTYKKVSIVEDDVNSAKPARPDKLDLTSSTCPDNVKPSPRLSLKIYECKTGSSEFVEKSGTTDDLPSHQKLQRKDDIMSVSESSAAKPNGCASTKPSSPVILRQKPVEMRKLVDLKQPEPNGLWRRGGEDRASDRKTWGSLRSSPRRSDNGEDRASDRKTWGSL